MNAIVYRVYGGYGRMTQTKSHITALTPFFILHIVTFTVIRNTTISVAKK